MRNIPTLRLSYGNLLLKELESRRTATIRELLNVPDVESLFKGERAHAQPFGRAQDLMRYATYLGLASSDSEFYTLTDAGRQYTAEIDTANPWIVNDAQRAVLYGQIAQQSSELARDAAVALDVQRELNELEISASDEEYGRYLAQVSQYRAVAREPDV